MKFNILHFSILKKYNYLRENITTETIMRIFLKFSILKAKYINKLNKRIYIDNNKN